MVVGYVGAEGFGDPRINVLAIKPGLPPDTTDVDNDLAKHNFKERVFMLVPPQQHTAAAALAKHLEAHPNGVPMSPVEARLRESARLEKRLNEENTSATYGQVVQFGQVVQLLHLNSAKYVTVRPRALAATERDAMRVELAETGSDDAHFEIVSKYSHISRGDEVLLGDDVAFVSEPWQVKLHVGRALSVAAHAARGSKFFELNGSGTGATFTLQRFSVHGAASLDGVGGNDLVRFYHYAQCAYVCGPRLCPSMPDDPDLYSIQGLWQVQHVNIKDGSAVASNSVVCLRHVASGQFLHIDPASCMTAALTPSRSSLCHFQLCTESALGDHDLRDDRPVFLYHLVTRAYLGVADADTGSVVGRERPHADKANAFRLQLVRPSAAKESLFLLSMLPQLHGAREALMRHVVAETGSAVHNLLADCKHIQRVLTELTSFCYETPVPPLVTTAASLPRHTPRQPHQRLLAEMNVIPLLIQLLQAPFVNWGGRLTLHDASESRDRLLLWAETLEAGVRDVCQHAYRLLFALIHDHRSNASLLAPYITTCLCQLGYGLFAEDIVGELVAIDSAFVAAIPSSAVDVLLDILRTRGKQAIFMVTLIKLVSFRGRGLPDKQARVCAAVFNAAKWADTDNPLGVDLAVLDNFRGPNLEVCIDGAWMPLYKVPAVRVEYVAASLRFLAALCVSRNYIGISLVEQLLPRATVLEAVQDNQLGDELRSELCRVLVAAYIDRLPHQTTCIPSKVHVVVADTPPEVVKEDPFFNTLKGIIKETLAGSPSPSEVLLGILHIAHRLMGFGHYRDEPELHGLVQAVLPLLRTTKEAAQDKQEYTIANFSPRVRGAIPLSKVVPAMPVDTKSSQLSMKRSVDMGTFPQEKEGPPLSLTRTELKCKLVMCRLLKWCLQLSVDQQLDSVVKLVFDRVEERVAAHNAPLSLPFARLGFGGMEHTLNRPESDADWCKLWSSHQLEIAVDCEKMLHTTLFHRLVGCHDLTGILLDLLATEYPGLVSASLDVLGSYYNTHRELLKHLDDIVVVTDAAMLEQYGHIVKHASILRLYDETSESWLPAAVGDTWKEVLQTLLWFVETLHSAPRNAQLLLHALHIDDVVMSITESIGTFLLTTPRSLGNKAFLRRHERLLDACYKVLVLHAWDHLAAQTKLALHLQLFQRLVAAQHMRPAILFVIARDNLSWCRALPPSFLPFVVRLIDERGPVPEFLDILSAVAVCRGVPIKENQTSISLLLMAPQRRPHVLERYLHVEAIGAELKHDNVAALGALVGDVKAQVAAVVRSPLFDHRSPDDDDIVFSGATSEDLHERLDSFMASFHASATTVRCPAKPALPPVHGSASAPHRSQANATPPPATSMTGSILALPSPLLYYAKLLELLTNLTAGANFICEARLQGLLPLEAILWALHSPSTPLPIQTQLLRVLHEAWLSTEQFVVEVAGNLKLLAFVCSQPARLSVLFPHDIPQTSAAAFQGAHGHATAYLFDALLPVLTDYFHVHCNPIDLHDDLKRAVVDLATAIGRVATLLQNHNYDWYAIVDVRKLEAANAFLDASVALVPGGNLVVPCFGSDPRPPEKEPSLPGRHLRLFVQWLQSAPFYVARTADEKRDMLSAFLDSSESVDFVLRRLLAHIKASEVGRGDFAQHSTLECLVVLGQIASSNPALLQSLGAAKTVAKLYCTAHEKDTKTHEELIALAISLLESGNSVVQAQFYSILSTDKSTWFPRVAQTLRSAIADLEVQRLDGLTTEVPDYGDVVQLLEVHRLLCEGHNEALQNLLRLQPSSHSVNVVQLIVKLFNALVKHLRPQLVPMLQKTLETIIELIQVWHPGMEGSRNSRQGPCEGNQLAVINPSERNGANFIDMAMVLFGLSDSSYGAGDLYNLQYLGTLALVSLVEGRHDTVIHERLAGFLSVRLLKDTLTHHYSHFLKKHQGLYLDNAFDAALISPEARQRDNYALRVIKIWLGQAHLPIVHQELVPPPKDDSKIYLDAGFNIYKLFHRLLEAPGIAAVLRSALIPSETEAGAGLLYEYPTLFGGVTITVCRLGHATKHVTNTFQLLMNLDRAVSYPEAYEFFESHCACIEVMVPDGRGAKQLQRFYFPKPPICAFLTSDMRDACMTDVNRDSPAEKVSDLFHRSDALIAEMTHRYLIVIAGDLYFTIGKTVSFILAIAINGLLLDCYVDTDDPRFSGFPLPSHVHKTDARYNMACIGTVGSVSKNTILMAFGIAQAISSGFIVLIYAVMYLYIHPLDMLICTDRYGPLIMLERWKRQPVAATKPE
ncbi:inositol 1,4,5-trisphosphate receptor type 1 isoform 1, partial [Achlya hypogyna]